KPLNVDETAKKCNLHPESVYTIRKDFIVFGMERITQRKKRETPPVEPKVTGDVEAHIIATACSQPPEGRAKWTLQLRGGFMPTRANAELLLIGHMKLSGC
ncbi:MAG: hypothetical protein FWG45_06730, partial [Oscillospiraceae bacterium]|nr:hypothetical protein [Oscillospiraceae bacterium]